MNTFNSNAFCIIFHLFFFTKIAHIFPFLEMDFKKNSIIVHLQIISEPTIIYNSIFSSCVQLLKSSRVGEEKGKIWLLLNFWKLVYYFKSVL